MSADRRVVIYGKDTCPYTAEAREAFAGRGYAVDYRNVKRSAPDLEEMLAHSKGVRQVPVILENGGGTIGPRVAFWASGSPLTPPPLPNKCPPRRGAPPP